MVGLQMKDATIQLLVICSIFLIAIIYFILRCTYNRRNGTCWHQDESRPECPKCSIKMIDKGFFKTKWRCRVCEGKQ